MTGTRFCVVSGLLLLLGLAGSAYGELYPFEVIPAADSDPTDAAIGEAQLTLEVTESNGGVLFTFANSGPEPSVIRMAAFENDLLASIDSLIEPTGVDFEVDGNVANLPRGNSLSPPFAEAFTVSAVAPPPPNGVGPDETLGVLFDLEPGVSFANVISAIESGALRVGIHVIAFESGGSESFVAVPLPGSVLLGMLGMGAVGWWQRRRMA